MVLKFLKIKYIAFLFLIIAVSQCEGGLEPAFSKAVYSGG